MIYSIGYQKRTLPELISILAAHKVTHLVDVRSKPYGRKVEFNKSKLEPALALVKIGYLSLPDLGGFGTIEETSISFLAEYQKDKTVCIMCMEHDPAQCHRGYEISSRLEKYGTKVHHL